MFAKGLLSSVTTVVALCFGGFAQQVHAQDGTQSCVTNTFSGPSFASIVYRNGCDAPLTVKVCSKFMINELWSTMLGDPTGGAWDCSGVRTIQPGGVMDIRIVAVEESSTARKALAEASYRLFSCPYGQEPLVKNAAASRYDCYTDPAGLPVNWAPEEFARLTAIPLKVQDNVTGYVPVDFNCRQDVRHVVAAVLPDGPLTATSLIQQIRYVQLGLTYQRGNLYCKLNKYDKKMYRFQFNAFQGEKKVFVLNYQTTDQYEFPDYKALKTAIESALPK